MILKILLIGRVDRSESKPLADWICGTFSPIALRQFSCLPTALADSLRTNWIPDMVVVVQSESDEFSGIEIASLFSFAPLARLVVAYGVWCESDGRNRNQWPMAVRVPLRHSIARVEREWNILHSENISRDEFHNGSLPPSASREEIFLADYSGSSPQNSRSVVLIDTPDSAYREFLVELLSSANHTVFSPATSEPGIQPKVIVFDSDPWTATRAVQLRCVCQQYPRAQVMSVFHMSHPVDILETISLSSGIVLSKLSSNSALLNAIQSQSHSAPTA